MVGALARTPVVLVHGWAGSAESWLPVQKALDTEVWEIIALRLPGSPGGSKGAATVSHAARQLVSVIQELPRPAVLVGHSMGAQLTLLAHAEVPDLVHSEVVIDPAYAGDATSRQEMENWAAQIELLGLPSVSDFFADATIGMAPADAARVLEDLRATDPAVIASYLRSEYVDSDAIGLNPVTARIARQRCRPVLSVHSTRESVQREAHLPTSPGSKSEVWKGHGHYLHLEDPQRFVALLDDWRVAHAERETAPRRVDLQPD